MYDDKIYIIAKQKYNTPKKCTTATHPRCAQCTYILQIVIQKNASTIHPRCVGAVVGEYCVEAVTSGYLPIARPAPFSFFISLVLFVCLFCFGISLVTSIYTWPCEAFALLVLDLLCFFFSFFGILSMTSGYLPIASLHPFSWRSALFCFVSLSAYYKAWFFYYFYIWLLICLFFLFFCIVCLFVVSCLLVWENVRSSDQSSNCKLVTRPALVCCCINGWT